jgi:AraC family transcriptional activator of tynA and feaB
MPGMHELLSTQAVAPREQLDRWRDILCSSFVDMRIERPVDRSFRGQLARRSFGSVLVARVDAQAHDVVRRRVDEDAYLISIQTRGRGMYAQDGRVASISSGGISVLDCRSPFEIAFPGEFSTLTIKVPRPSLRVRPSSPKSLGGLSLPARTGLTRLVRDYVQRLLTVGAEADMAVREALACNLCDLMGLAVNVRSREDIASGPASVLLDAILLHIKGNLADPDLSPPKVADHFGISVRYLHKLFERTDSTFNRHVLELRLRHCYAVLTDAKQSSKTVAAIAYASGFNDLSYFGRSFRRRFGAAPSEFLKVGQKVAFAGPVHS